ncbi:aminotransferase class IV [Teredinibacter franksiae]|uniref:aminotransferase class IV n=1 Tax=Teredinibacter franksiae TaxID=2761453 RepID=UPI0016293237|nr:aminotransferase class IV [Teredinibacter franksiae]
MAAGNIRTFVSLNGQLASETSISVNNRGFMYGDGIFETVRVSASKLPLMLGHLKRLKCGADFLNFALDTKVVLSAVESLVDQLNSETGFDGILKIIIYRRESERASYPLNTAVDVLCTLSPCELQNWQQQPVSLRPASGMLFSKAEHAAVKMLSRVDYLTATKHDALLPHEELLLCDETDCVIDTPHHNIFWRKRQRLYTPCLKTAGVKGVMRQYLLENSSLVSVGPVDVGRYKLKDLLAADEIFLTNAVRGIVPVNCFNGRDIDDHVVAKTFAQLLATNLR